jgi:hypothetical protein
MCLGKEAKRREHITQNVVRKVVIMKQAVSHLVLIPREPLGIKDRGVVHKQVGSGMGYPYSDSVGTSPEVLSSKLD